MKRSQALASLAYTLGREGQDSIGEQWYEILIEIYCHRSFRFCFAFILFCLVVQRI